MNPVTSPADGAGEERTILLALTSADEECRIRRSMRVDPKKWAKKARRALPVALLHGALLLTGGFCLGWRAFKIWNN